VLFGWFYNYVLYRRGARLITGEQSWKSLSALADEAAGRAHEAREEPGAPHAR
jgi:hypothetical protein